MVYTITSTSMSKKKYSKKYASIFWIKEKVYKMKPYTPLMLSHLDLTFDQKKI